MKRVVRVLGTSVCVPMWLLIVLLGNVVVGWIDGGKWWAAAVGCLASLLILVGFYFQRQDSA